MLGWVIISLINSHISKMCGRKEQDIHLIRPLLFLGFRKKVLILLYEGKCGISLRQPVKHEVSSKRCDRPLHTFIVIIVWSFHCFYLALGNPVT